MRRRATSRESGLSRVVGATPEQEEDVKKSFQAILETQGAIPNLEREKTESEKEIIESLVEKARGFVARYGGKPVGIKPENVHIIDLDRATEADKRIMDREFGGLEERAKYIFNVQAILMGVDRHTPKTKLRFAHTVAHELMHMNSFQSVNRTGERTLSMRRFGLGIASGARKEQEEKHFFALLDEAVTEELHMRFVAESFRSIGPLKGELEFRDKWLRRIDPASGVLPSEVEFVDESSASEEGGPRYYLYSYHKERQRLNQMIDEIYRSKHNRFQSREGVFEVFARAYFTGRLLNLARLIEKTYGKGSFVEIAKATEEKRHITGDDAKR